MFILLLKGKCAEDIIIIILTVALSNVWIASGSLLQVYLYQGISNFFLTYK